ncbi:T9SS type A sorting domain-containing protein, partial [Candidatus Fermentibacteria bacterium]|nr:T9SS type A sorting domain-containing protein [Candidatus Fermentibacteria bacterium]
PSEFELAASCNPFDEMVTITAAADPLPRQLAVYDLSGRLIRSLGNGRNEGVFLWDGSNASGEEVPPGTYLIRAASEGRLASLRLVKL